MADDWTSVDLAACELFYDTVFVDGKIKEGEPTDGDMYFVLPLELEPDLTYEFAFDVVTVGTWSTDPSESVWSMITLYSTKGTPDEDYWYYYYRDTYIATPQGLTTTLTRLVGPGKQQWDLARGVGETRVMVEATDVVVTGIRYRTTDDPSIWAPYSLPLRLDVTPTWEGPWTDSNGRTDYAANHDNYYSTAARVWDDVVVVAWSTQGNQGWAYEARAVRVTADPSGGAPIVEAGPTLHGPWVADLPGWDPAWGDPAAAVESDYRLSWVVRVRDGVAFIQGAMNNYPQPHLGHFVSVDSSSLEITHMSTVPVDPDHTAPGNQYRPSEWAWPAAYGHIMGNDRVLIQTEIEGDVPTVPVNDGYSVALDRLLISIAPDGTMRRRYKQKYAAIGAPAQTNDLFNWNAVMCIADMGTYWVSLHLATVKDASNNYPIQIWRHDDDDGFPADNPTLVGGITGGERGNGFDFDGTYMTPMANGLIYVLETAYQNGGDTGIWVINPQDWSMTRKVIITPQAHYFGAGAHLLDYMSIEPIDEKTAFVAWSEYSTSPKAWVATFDGEHMSNKRAVFYLSWSEDPYYPNRHIYGWYNYEAYFLPGGLAVAICNGSQDTHSSMPPAPPEDPVLDGCTWAVGVQLWPQPKVMRGGQVGDRRVFKGTKR